jgi:hypothetical protein
MEPVDRWRAAFTAVAAMLLAAAGFILVRETKSRYERAADPPGVLREIRMLKELVTVRYSIQKVAGLTEPKQPVGSESILLIVQAKVLGGVDLAEMREADIRVKGPKTVAIGLAPARILHVYLDENHTQVWDRTKTWWTPWVPYSKDLEQRARLSALESVRQEAIDMGILREAQQSAETMIRGLLRPLGFETVEFYRPST